ncbi:hypothetical protein [Hwanghaeella sp. LZ110]|uniref:hypothetical protein n=1 Tax=Hwanghaeella sp. LZ110 TaxID=3402810 RepID=UPI003B67D5B0
MAQQREKYFVGASFSIATMIILLILVTLANLNFASEKGQELSALNALTQHKPLVGAGLILLVQVIFAGCIWPRKGSSPDEAAERISIHYYLGFVSTLIAIAVSMYFSTLPISPESAAKQSTETAAINSTSASDADSQSTSGNSNVESPRPETAPFNGPITKNQSQEQIKQFLVNVSTNAAAAVSSTVIGFIIHIVAKGHYSVVRSRPELNAHFRSGNNSNSRSEHESSSKLSESEPPRQKPEAGFNDGNSEPVAGHRYCGLIDAQSCWLNLVKFLQKLPQRPQDTVYGIDGHPGRTDGYYPIYQTATSTRPPCGEDEISRDTRNAIRRYSNGSKV